MTAINVNTIPTISETSPSPSSVRSAPPQPYSLPWQLRPLSTGHLLRVDSVGSVFNDANGNLDEAVITVLAASYQLTQDWAPMVRLGFVGNDAPGAAADGSSFVNPLVGATYTRAVGGCRLALFGGLTIPLGAGGGHAPQRGAAKANAASTTARPADSAMFAVDHTTAIVGASFAYVNHGLTAQAEVTLSPSVRVRGDHNGAATDAFRVSSAGGLHLGYFIGAHLSLGSDLFYQRRLSQPTTLDPVTGATVPLSGARRDTVTVAAGPRFHFQLGQRTWIRPGLSFMRGLDGRGSDATLLITAATTAVQIDVPVMF